MPLFVSSMNFFFWQCEIYATSLDTLASTKHQVKKRHSGFFLINERFCTSTYPNSRQFHCRYSQQVSWRRCKVGSGGSEPLLFWEGWLVTWDISLFSLLRSNCASKAEEVVVHTRVWLKDYFLELCFFYNSPLYPIIKQFFNIIYGTQPTMHS